MSSDSGTSRAKSTLTAPAVIASAMELADAEGLEAVTMRRLAGELRVTPMALYNHVDNRDALIDAMLDSAVGQLPASQPSDDWRVAIRARILGAHDLIVSHGWMKTAIESRTRATPATLAYMDSLIAIMFAGGLSADIVHYGMHALSTRMWGFTRDVLPTPEVPQDPEAAALMFERFAATYPAIIRMATTAPGAGGECDTRSELNFALDVILDGIEARHLRGWSSLS